MCSLGSEDLAYLIAGDPEGSSGAAHLSPRVFPPIPWSSVSPQMFPCSQIGPLELCVWEEIGCSISRATHILRPQSSWMDSQPFLGHSVAALVAAQWRS